MRRHLPPIIALAIMHLVYLWPLPVAPGRYAINAGDTANMIWVLNWGARQLVRDPRHLYDGNILRPHPKSFAYTDTALGDAPLSVPIRALTGDPVVTYNVTLFLVFLLTSLSTYALAYDMVGSRGAAFFAAVAFGFASYRRWNIDTINLCSLQWLPLALLSLRRGLRAARTGRGRFWPWMVLFAVSFAMNALSSWYYAFMLAVALPFFVATEVPWREARRVVGPIAAGVALTALLTLPGALPYLWLHSHMPGFVREIDEVEAGSAELADYVSWDYSSTIYRAARGWNIDVPLHDGPEPSFDRKIFARPLPFFPGVLVVLAVLASFGHGRASRIPRAALLLMALAGVVLSLGPYKTLLGWRVPLPYLLLYRHVPGWQGLRWVSRFSLLLTLAFALLSAYGLAALGASAPCRRRRRVCATLVTVAALLTFAEKLTLPLHLTTIPPDVPAVYSYLATLPPENLFVEAPTRQEALYTYYAARHWLPTAGGLTSWQPAEFEAIRASLGQFPAPSLWRKLRASGITHIVVHYHFFLRPRPDMERAAVASPLFHEVARFGDDVVYEVVAAPASRPEPDTRSSNIGGPP